MILRRAASGGRVSGNEPGADVVVDGLAFCNGGEEATVAAAGGRARAQETGVRGGGGSSRGHSGRVRGRLLVVVVGLNAMLVDIVRGVVVVVGRGGWRLRPGRSKASGRGFRRHGRRGPVVPGRGVEPRGNERQAGRALPHNDGRLAGCSSSHSGRGRGATEAGLEHVVVLVGQPLWTKPGALGLIGGGGSSSRLLLLLEHQRSQFETLRVGRALHGQSGESVAAQLVAGTGSTWQGHNGHSNSPGHLQMFSSSALRLEFFSVTSGVGGKQNPSCSSRLAFEARAVTCACRARRHTFFFFVFFSFLLLLLGTLPRPAGRATHRHTHARGSQAHTDDAQCTRGALLPRGGKDEAAAPAAPCVCERVCVCARRGRHRERESVRCGPVRPTGTIRLATALAGPGDDFFLLLLYY